MFFARCKDCSAASPATSPHLRALKKGIGEAPRAFERERTRPRGHPEGLGEKGVRERQKGRGREILIKRRL
eukprot:11185558-Alexandrium_andersonii.AAC.1